MKQQEPVLARRKDTVQDKADKATHQHLYKMFYLKV